MKRIRILVTLTGVLTAMGIAADRAVACTCFKSPVSACELYEEYDVALVGRVVKAGAQGGDAWIRIDRAVKGATAGGVEVMRNMDASSFCGYPFRVSVDYIVLARRIGGEIIIDGCTRAVWDSLTPGYSDALRFIDSLARPPTGGWIFGTVEHIEPHFARSGMHLRAVRGATVSLTGPVDERAEVIEGRYDFTGLPPGKYTINVSVPAPYPPAKSLRGPAQSLDSERWLALERAGPSREVTIAHERSCAFAPFGVGANGRVSGVVIDFEGKPAAGIRVEVAPASAGGRNAIADLLGAETDAQGRYELALPALQLGPPSTPRRLSGVVFLDDRPLPGVAVSVGEAEGTRYLRTLSSTHTDGDGRFTFAVFDARSYIVTAEARVAAWTR
jgi:5-hydroxyisourate hydrolase-like protein (transthyretin family)